MAWNQNSVVKVCDECEGAGVVASTHRRPTIDDPYPEIPCEYGCSEHLPECAVCGFDQEIDGYDCLACATVESLYDKDFAVFDADKFAAAIKVAMEARRNERLAA